MEYDGRGRGDQWGELQDGRGGGPPPSRVLAIPIPIPTPTPTPPQPPTPCVTLGAPPPGTPAAPGAGRGGASGAPGGISSAMRLMKCRTQFCISTTSSWGSAARCFSASAISHARARGHPPPPPPPMGHVEQMDGGAGNGCHGVAGAAGGRDLGGNGSTPAGLRSRVGRSTWGCGGGGRTACLGPTLESGFTGSRMSKKTDRGRETLTHCHRVRRCTLTVGNPVDVWRKRWGVVVPLAPNPRPAGDRSQRGGGGGGWAEGLAGFVEEELLLGEEVADVRPQPEQPTPTPGYTLPPPLPWVRRSVPCRRSGGGSPCGVP